MERPTCKTCSLWESWGETYGECRRHAPTATRSVIEDSSVFYADWPRTRETDWCGEHDMFWKYKQWLHDKEVREAKMCQAKSGSSADPGTTASSASTSSSPASGSSESGPSASTTS